MKKLLRRSLFLLFIFINQSLALHAESSNPSNSMGDLVRSTPTDLRSKALIAVYGDPLVGLGDTAGHRLQRIGNADKWGMETKGHVSIFQMNRQTGQTENQGSVAADPGWSLAPDGTRFFASRTSEDHYTTVWECFDFTTGKSLWNLDKNIVITDSAFSPDGTKIIILEGVNRVGREVDPAVSWYDSRTGERLRQVKLPGKLCEEAGRYLGITSGAVYVAIPQKSVSPNDYIEVIYEPHAYVIPEGSDQATPLDLGDVSSNAQINILVGGPHNELVAFHNADVVEIFREENGALSKVEQIKIAYKMEGSFFGMAAFSPDGSRLVASSRGSTVLVSTAKPKVLC